MDDDSGIVLGTRSDFEETDANHSEAGPEIATGLTSSDLRCASQCTYRPCIVKMFEYAFLLLHA